VKSGFSAKRARGEKYAELDGRSLQRGEVAPQPIEVLLRLSLCGRQLSDPSFGLDNLLAERFGVGTRDGHP
jgi:hypothetical protein